MKSRQQTKPATVAGATRSRLPDGSRSVQSPWVWRGFLFMSLIAIGLCLTLVSAGDRLYATAWGVIAAGWFALSMWLWRRHVLDDDQAWSARIRTGGRPT
jgi:hypothetical protein